LQADLHCKGPGRHCLPGFFKTFFICRLIDLRSVASLSDAERTTEEALRRELLVNWDELFTVKPAG
jgi:hypothetical protein